MPVIRPVAWIGSAKEDLSAFPEEVKDSIGFALYVAQQGGKHRDTKPLSGFGGSGVVEIIKDYRGDTFRAAYTLRYQGAVLCTSRLPEEIQDRAGNTAAGYG